MKQKKGPKRKIIFYYAIVIVAIIIINTLIRPSIRESKIEEIDYSVFINMIEDDEVKSVTIEDREITIKPKDEESDVIYSTGRMEDPDLIERLEESNVEEYNREIPKELSPFLNFILTWILPILIFFLLGQLLFRSMQKRMGGGNAMSFGKSNAKVYVPDEAGKTFEDVAGQDEAKEALTELVDFLHEPGKYTKIGAQLPKGALLVGPPGTGKTLLAQAVAGEAEVPFFSISGSEFIEMFVGMGASKIRDLFKQAQEKAPCIVFIDEIDTIGKKRDSGGISGNDEREQTLNQLLSEMDGFDGNEGVVILAATNRPDSLDKALLRPGRFDRRIPVELPDIGGRKAVLEVHAKDVKMDKDVDFESIARATAGGSGADLANIINEAALRAVKNDRDAIAQEDLEESVEIILAGYERKNAVISSKEKRIIAYHEVGHALVAANQTDSDPVHKITIIPRTSGALGYTMQLPEDESNLMSKEELFNKIVTLTGGRAAEDIVFGSITSGASNDIEQATKIARSMVTRFGMSDKFGMMALETVTNKYLGGDASLACSEETSYGVDQEVLNIINEAYAKAENILNENREKLIEISNYLLEMETITGEKFMEILKA